MFKEYFAKRRQARILRRERLKRLNNIDEISFDDETQVSPKKAEEIKELINWLVELVDDHGFHVDETWSIDTRHRNAWSTNQCPNGATLENDFDSGAITINVEIDITGQMFDRVGKISIGVNWAFYGTCIDEDEDIYVGAFEKEKTCTLHAAKKLLPKILKETL